MREIEIIKERIASSNLPPLTPFAESELEKYPAMAEALVGVTKRDLFETALGLFMMGTKVKERAAAAQEEQSGTSYEEIEKVLMIPANREISPGDRLMGKHCFYESSDGPIKHAVFVRYLMPSEMPQVVLGQRFSNADCVIAVSVDACGMPFLIPAFSGYFEIDE